LGGEDFDERLVNHFAAEFQRKHKKDLKTSARALRRCEAGCRFGLRVLTDSQVWQGGAGH
jgi:L1 cell adhesion molecule like protein